MCEEEKSPPVAGNAPRFRTVKMSMGGDSRLI